jgi:putative tryptophan/tyrosine transport system substrate-binding protein
VRRREFIAGLGGAAARPLAARAQQSNQIRHIAVLMAFDEDDARAKSWLSRFTSGMAELGWTNGRNLRTDVRWAGADVSQMQVFAKELVSQRPDLILSFGTPVTAALQHETRTIPIVFAIVSDPVGEHFVATLARPGGNITGFHNSEDSIGGKWLELLKQAAPGVKRAAMIFNPDTSPRHGQYYMPDFEAAAKSLNVAAMETPMHSVADLESIISDLGREPGCGFVAMADFFLFINRSQMISLAAQNNVPAVYPWREVPLAGGLLLYGPDLADIVSRVAPYVNRILKGESPAELPVQVPTKFEIVLNLKAAKALSLDISPSLLARADEVIE